MRSFFIDNQTMVGTTIRPFFVEQTCGMATLPKESLLFLELKIKQDGKLKWGHLC